MPQFIVRRFLNSFDPIFALGPLLCLGEFVEALLEREQLFGP